MTTAGTGRPRIRSLDDVVRAPVAVADRVVGAPVLGPHALAVVEHVLAVLDGTPSAGCGAWSGDGGDRRSG